jgi:hypothetical protein
VRTPRIVLIAIGGAPLLTACQPATERAAFVTTLGRDTVVLESFTRRAGRLDGWIVVRVPGTVLIRYELALDRDDRVTRSHLRTEPLSAPQVTVHSATLEFVPDSVRVSLASADQQTTATRALPAGAPVLFMTGFGSSYGLYFSMGMQELLLPRIPVSAADTTTFVAVDAGNGRVARRQFLRRSEREVAVDYFGIAWTHLTLDASGRIVGADAIETTEKTRTVRTEYLDVERAARDYAALDRQGRGLGVASPDTTVTSALGAASITLTYGRPRKRGREILGTVVPYDQVWRTGANAATAVTTTHDLVLGGASIPAGSYTLWTRPSRDGVDLIVNRETGQWGTSYDPSKDLVRVPMRAATAAAREKFEIRIVPAGASGELRIAWDTFEWRVPVRLR